MTNIQKDIEVILGECVGEDREWMSDDFEDGGDDEYRSRRIAVDNANVSSYNQAKREIRTRIPETARRVLERVR